jgi:hypothetical protein
MEFFAVSEKGEGPQFHAHPYGKEAASVSAPETFTGDAIAA